MYNGPIANGSTSHNSLIVVYVFLVIIFFVLIMLFVVINAILVHQLVKDSEELTRYLEHYGRNWLSLLSQLIAITTLSCAVIVIIFSLYLLKRHSSNCFRSDLGLSRYFAERTSVNRSLSESTNSQQIPRVITDIHIERSIIFH